MLSPKRQALKERLTDAGERQIAKGGIVALKARELAAEVGCALGGIYSAYGDLGELAVEVNRRTLEQLEEHLRQAVVGLTREGPEERLISLAQAYLDYAEREGPRWRTLFSIGLSEDGEHPGFFDALQPVIDLIKEQLDELYPAKTSRTLEGEARLFFAALHGAVSLGMESRLSVLERQGLQNRLTTMVEKFAA